MINMIVYIAASC